MNKKLEILVLEKSEGYELLDSGEGEKLERWGGVITRRPDPQALWKKNQSDSEWKKADAVFTRDSESAKWTFKHEESEKKWQIPFEGLKFWIKPTAFKHTGLFPEQAENWKWMKEIISDAKGGAEMEIEVLNLFGYTGGASLSCATAGAKVTHVDSSKSAITWANENAEASGLKEKSIRWILEDARSFVNKEIKRGRKYDGILLDPPAFGHGANDEVWKIEEDFLPFIKDCMELLSEKPLFFLINGYSAGYSAIAYENNLLPLLGKFGGKIEIGELTVKETGNTEEVGNLEKNSEARLLPCGIFARWKK